MTAPQTGRTHQWRGVIEEYRDLLDDPRGHRRRSPCARAARRWSSRSGSPG